MPSFRSPKSQAIRAVSRMSAHGHSRAETRGQAGISSVGTGRSYVQALRQFASHLKDHRAGDLQSATPAQARNWLASRAAEVGQKALDQNRQALAAWYQHRGETLGLKKSDCQSTAATGRGLADQQRYYSPAQVEAIAACQSERNALATRIAAEAGLRAAELATIARTGEQPAARRDWRADRHTGRGDAVRYTVRGKGGLVREVSLSRSCARALEARRLAAPQRVTDRGIHQTRRYDISSGNAWSRSFTDASRRVLGFSRGAHGLRHTYAHERMERLQSLGYAYDDARAVVAQEVGHWQAATTQAYLR